MIKFDRKAAFEAVVWLLIILATLVTAAFFDWNTAQTILQYILVFGAITSIYFYLQSRSLLRESMSKNKELSERERLIKRFQKTTDLFFQNSADGILVLDEEQRIESFSPGMEKISGYSEKEAVGHLAQHLLKFHSSETGSLLPDLMFTVPEVRKEHPYIKNALVSKDGKEVDIEASYALIRNPETKKAVAMAIIRDVSYEKALTERDKEFIAVTSHQLNTPLSIIRGYSSMMISGKAGVLNQKEKEYVEEIHKSAEKMYDLTSNLLSISRIEQQKIKLSITDINVSDFFKDIEKAHTSGLLEKQVKITFPKIERNQIIAGDYDKLKQAVDNVIDNAIKYTKEGEVKIDAKLGKNRLIIEVSDTGIGIPKEEIEKIGTRFYRTQEAINIDHKGTGLGMYITKAIVEKHGGSLNIESTLGSGSKFILSIPIKAKENDG